MVKPRRDSFIESHEEKEEEEEEEIEEEIEEEKEIEEEDEEEEIEEEEEEEEEEGDEEMDMDISEKGRACKDGQEARRDVHMRCGSRYKDTSQKLEFEGHGEDLSLISSTPGRSESNPESPSKDVTGGNFVAYNSSTEIPVASNKKASNASVAAVQSLVQDRHISFEEKGCSESPGCEKEIKVSLEKKMPNDNPECAKNSYLEAHGIHQYHLSSGNFIGSENAAPLQVHNKELNDANMVKGVSTIWQSNVILEKDVQHLRTKTEMKLLEDLSMSSMHLTQRRPRSSSPGASSENLSKKPAIICDFYARGWCIKGSSCRFLHQKEESKEDFTETTRKGDVRVGTGSRGEAERLRISSPQDQLDLSSTESSSKSQSQMQAPVRTYGGESHGSPDSHNDNNIHAGEEYKSPFRRSPQLKNVNERQNSDHFSPRRYLHEGKLQGEMPRREFLNDFPFSRGSSLMTSLAATGSSTSSSLYLNNNNPFSKDKRMEDVVLQNYQRKFPLHGSHSSYSLNGALNSSFSSSYQLAPPLSFSSERFNTHRSFEFDEGCHNSRSVSLPRSSYLRSEVENVVLHNVPRNLSASIRQKIGTRENSWEPSVPFRPSFHYAFASFSSPGSQYDPLLDSIEPRNSGNIALDFSSYSTKGDSQLYGYHVPGYNEERTLSSFPQPHEGILDKSVHAHVLSGQTALEAMPGHAGVDGHASVPKEEKHLTPDHVVGSANVNDSEQHQGDKDRISKESKVMKVFRAALVEFVKELVKPSWREGHLSKDAHKMIVKKAVEKVLGALQGYQIPNNTESINQYLSASRPKLLKLVEGYVVKYAKS